jgi:hypothetical protein
MLEATRFQKEYTYIAVSFEVRITWVLLCCFILYVFIFFLIFAFTFRGRGVTSVFYFLLRFCIFNCFHFGGTRSSVIG